MLHPLSYPLACYTLDKALIAADLRAATADAAAAAAALRAKAAQLSSWTSYAAVDATADDAGGEGEPAGESQGEPARHLVGRLQAWWGAALNGGAATRGAPSAAEDEIAHRAQFVIEPEDTGDIEKTSWETDRRRQRPSSAAELGPALLQQPSWGV